jgi:hypothetical protein
MAYVSRSPPIIPDGQISRVRFETSAFFRRPSQAWRGLNAGPYTPPPSWFAPSLASWTVVALRRFYQAGRHTAKKPPSVLSPFAQLRCYLRWGDVYRLLRGRYPSVIAPTGSCATPVGLSPASAFSLVRRVLAGCTQSLLPTGASRRYLWESFLGCWIPYPGGTPCALACFFHDVIGLPQAKNGSASRVLSRELRLLVGPCFEDADIP